MKKLSILAFTLACLLISAPSFSQGFLNKLKRQTENKLLKKSDDVTDDILYGKDKNDSNNTGTNPQNTGNNNTSLPTGNNSGMSNTNTTGSGLIMEAPDVLKNINDAEQAYNAQSYGSAKYAVRQAMLGIEMEIGHKILASLPESVDGLGMVAEKDKVTSMGYGFVGLNMQRYYQSGNKELRINIGNNSALFSAANMMLSSGAYASSSNDQNYKQTMFKGHRSVLQYSDHSGYTLSVPFGQSSIMVLDGINYDSEDAIMTAAENFDIEYIKKELGEK